ncbi:MAG: mechanosensitive ion channel family protein [Sandaracinaceae bacterium]
MLEWMSSMSSEAWAVVSGYALQALGVLAGLLAAWVGAGWVRRWMLAGFAKANFDLTLARFFANVVRYAILVATVVGCLGAFGVETTSFAAVIGAAGLAVGLAFQGSLSNFAAGVMLLVFRPFKVGDFVTGGGVSGTIEQIELFTTEFRTPDNRKLIVPNSSVFGGTIENVTAHETRRVDIAVGVDYGADIDTTRAVLERAVASVSGRIEEPPSQVFLTGLGASSVDWKLRVWCKTEDYWTVYEAVIRAAKMHLDEAEIGIPFPQMDVHFDEDGLRAMGASRAA